jgi:hypothetical protein
MKTVDRRKRNLYNGFIFAPIAVKIRAGPASARPNDDIA